jgi:hypothetical protein
VAFTKIVTNTAYTNPVTGFRLVRDSCRLPRHELRIRLDQHHPRPDGDGLFNLINAWVLGQQQ